MICILILFAIIVKVTTEQCLTPNNETAQCVSLYSCPTLISTLTNRQQSSIDFLKKSNCGGTPSEPFVCCGTFANFVASNSTTKDRNSKMKLLPDKRFCGLQHSDDYLPKDNKPVIRINEFPWIARLVLKQGVECAGSIINRRYILTAAHCLVNPQNLNIKTVYLGDFNINNNTDCIVEPPYDQECSEIEEVGVERIIPHPGYHNRKKINDIALVRLNRKIEYSDYIRPVCLPFPGTRLAEIGDTLTSSGWGLGEIHGNRTDVKKKSLSTLITQEQCLSEYESFSLNLTENQLCTLPNRDTPNFGCQGDSGGPLMFSSGLQWHQEGVLSFGRGCGPDYPEVFSRVTSYLDWILDNVEE